MMHYISRLASPRHFVSLFLCTALALSASAAFAEQPTADGDASAPSPTMDALLAQGASDSATVSSDSTANTSSPTRESNGSSPVSLLLFAFGAGLICVAGVGAAKYSKRTPKLEEERLSHIQSMRLGNKHQISVVEVHGQLLLLGLADGHICLLDRLDAAARTEQAEASSPQSEGGENLTGAWDSMFKRAVNKRQQELAAKYGPDSQETDGSARATRKLTSLADDVSSRAHRSEVSEDSVVHDGLFNSFEGNSEALSERLSEASIARHERRRATRRSGDEWRREESRESDSVLIALKKFRDVGA